MLCDSSDMNDALWMSFIPLTQDVMFFFFFFFWEGWIFITQVQR